MFSLFVQKLSEKHSRGWFRGKPSPASTAGRCVLPSQLWWCCSCREAESQEMQGLSWKHRNHLGPQWGLGEFDFWSKSKHVFTTFIICIVCTNYFVGLSLYTGLEWGNLLSKRRARKYVCYIFISYRHLELLLHPSGRKHRQNSSLCELKTAAIATAAQNLDKFFCQIEAKPSGLWNIWKQQLSVNVKVPSSLHVSVLPVPTGLPAAQP